MVVCDHNWSITTGCLYSWMVLEKFKLQHKNSIRTFQYVGITYIHFLGKKVLNFFPHDIFKTILNLCETFIFICGFEVNGSRDGH